MAKGTIECRCNKCNKEFKMTRNFQNRSQADWWETNTEKHIYCPECYQQEEQKKNNEGLPELQGTEKQVVWASKIRREFLDRVVDVIKRDRTYIERNPENIKAKSHLEKTEAIYNLAVEKTETTFWIETRDKEAIDLMKELYKEVKTMKEQEECKTQKQTETTRELLEEMIETNKKIEKYYEAEEKKYKNIHSAANEMWHDGILSWEQHDQAMEMYIGKFQECEKIRQIIYKRIHRIAVKIEELFPDPEADYWESEDDFVGELTDEEKEVLDKAVEKAAREMGIEFRKVKMVEL